MRYEMGLLNNYKATLSSHSARTTEMGGEHKCPVCQATFTRPQHVARHMRSHTGDRPYKCQYCGDQFARSDLLSRHCNKCHANERPLPNAGTRRRGSASASRATTSKQACDQCVQSSLPCDGSNPCAKCVQRKCRCTYVKFHRQTAPVGPGHNIRQAGGAPPSSSAAAVVAATAAGLVPGSSGSSTGSRLSLYSQSDDFILGPPPPSVPSVGGVTSMADNLYSQSLTFPPLYPHQHNDPAATLGLGNNTEFTAKFRAQQDPYRRGSLPINPALPSAAAPGAGLIPGLYTDPRQPATSSWMASWGQENDPSYTSTNTHPEALHEKQPLQSDLPHHFMNPSNILMPPTADGTYTHPSAFIGSRDRRNSFDYTSESSSTTSQSLPSSAASSSVHLPLDNVNIHRSFPGDQQSAPGYPGVASQTDQPTRQYAPPRGPHEGFSSAFGLMSLDEPEMLAGLSTDGAPFFSNNALTTLGADDPNQTPMPSKQPEQASSQNQRSHPAASTPSREAEIRELRDFWKQYIRTPLSGPGLGSDATPGPLQRHSPPTFRRPRVASLPHTKTPLVADSDKYALHQQQAPHPNEGGGNRNSRNTNNENSNAMSSMRTTLHDQEDLRSYEAAVLARKAPTTLSLGPRARKKVGSQSSSPQAPSLQVEPSNVRFSYSPGSSRPSSATGPSSSLANWSGKPGHAQLAYTQDRVTSSPPSRESSLSIDDSAGSGGSDREGLRPSFKRLPSHTLGPTHAKRTQLSIDDDGEEDIMNAKPGLLAAKQRSLVGSGAGIPVYSDHEFGGGDVGSLGAGGVGGGADAYSGIGHQQSRHQYQQAPYPPHPERPVVNLSDRHRRMSAPTTVAPSASTFTFVAPTSGPT
ncbi:hypothetical protein AMATHDRAFT_42559 [Amanita thiersii Skay4041]|uniref:Zn(2)-C6 fungal-type domain-containing protein n=1 Tax=Amanita thiersii Skay4041 TaxID=703135 RepID=A0A2A9NJQ5_9AGAR|nr:hypothetical protein AMATHDRAFT_42559 [Amanita thiersii Skay4041]